MLTSVLLPIEFSASRFEIIDIYGFFACFHDAGYKLSGVERFSK